MNDTPTLHNKLEILRHMVDATENALLAEVPDESDANKRFRLQSALSNLKQLADVARAAERDLADGLANPNFLDSITALYGVASPLNV